MKKILIATDFSDTSYNAARYGLLLACYGKTDLLLLNVFSPPIPMVIEGTSVPVDALYDIAQEESDSQLSNIRRSLLNEAVDRYAQSDYLPSITTVSTIGEPKAAIKSYCELAGIDLLLMGINAKEDMVLGVSSGIVRRMMKSICVPLLLVPADWQCLPPRRIIFASDFSQDEILPMKMVCDLACIFNADFILFHYSSSLRKGDSEPERNFFNQVAHTVEYPRIYYHQGREGNFEQTLEKIEQQQQADMLVIIHRKHSLLGELLGLDHTLRMIGRARVPLLIFPNTL